MAECTCTGPGWCERHRIEKTALMFKLCQTKPKYFEAWEEGRGPGQPKKAGCSHAKAARRSKQKKATKPLGPGAVLCKMLGCGATGKKFTHAKEMDAWGPEGCLERIDTIVGWLLEPEAVDAEMSEGNARRLVELAVREVTTVS